MTNQIKFSLTPQQIDKLEFYSHLLKKDPDIIFSEALNFYFDAQEKILAQKEMGQSPETNLDYEEFWDGLDF
ncbi:MAG: hypothetical protein IE909_02235 [Campylobacterales bacterium]|nr:hypothetical protein [Campylobacterales bacterium]